MSLGIDAQTINFNKSVQQNAQMSFKAQNGYVKDYPQDTVEINGKKKGLSGSAKRSICFLGVAAIAIGLIARRTNQLTKVAEHIEFKEAKTVDEAIAWGKKNLGITDYEKYDNLEVLNWINRGLTDVQNNIPDKRRLFKKVSFKHGGKNWFARCPKDELELNRYILNDFDDFFSKDIETQIQNGLFINKHNVLKLPKQYQNCNKAIEIERLANDYRKNCNNLSWNEKIKLYEYVQRLNFLNNKTEAVSLSEANEILDSVTPYSIIFHESGHALHRKNINGTKYEKMGKLKEIEQWGGKDKSITEKFLNTKSIQSTAEKVSLYAKESPREFVAETFSGIMEGREFSEDVMALYRKYNGPKVRGK